MNSRDFWASISSIIKVGFDREGMITLEQYAIQFINRQLLFKRYTPFEQHGCAAGGGFHVVASILAGAETPADKVVAPTGSFERDCQRGKAQQAVIEEWARKVGCWVDNVDTAFDQAFGEQLAEGGEAHVYDNGNTIIKRIGLDYYILPELALDRITLHNALFPETWLTVLGFGKTTDGDFQVIVQQPFIHGSALSENEIRDYAESIGFKLINPRNWTYANSDIYLSDLHDENIIKSPQGNIFVIDCDVRINTPSLHCGGQRILTNEIQFLS